MDDKQIALLLAFLDDLKTSGTQSIDVEVNGYRVQVTRLTTNDIKDDTDNDEVQENAG